MCMCFESNKWVAKCRGNTRSPWLLRVCPIQFLILVLHALIAYIGNDENKHKTEEMRLSPLTHTNVQSSFLTWLCNTLNTTSFPLLISFSVALNQHSLLFIFFTFFISLLLLVPTVHYMKNHCVYVSRIGSTF